MHRDLRPLSLINREQTRREGLEILSVLVRNPLEDIPSDARYFRKTGLIWLHASPADRKLYENYRRMYPEDPIVRSLLSRIPKSAGRGNEFHLLWETVFDSGRVLLPGNRSPGRDTFPS